MSAEFEARDAVDDVAEVMETRLAALLILGLSTGLWVAIWMAVYVVKDWLR